MREGLEESASLPNVRNKGRARLDGVGDMEHARHCLHDGGYDRNRGAWRAGHGALLTAPFWLAFVLWPLFWIWRLFRDRQLWTEKAELLVHDPERSEPFGLEVLFGRDGVRVAVDEVNGVEGLSDALTGIPTRKPDEAAGIPFETYDAADLAAWGVAWLEVHPDGEGALAEFVRWADTLRRADNAARR